MKPVITNESNKRNYFALGSILIIFLFLYGYFLGKYKEYLVEFLNKKSSNYDVSYSSIRSSGLLIIDSKIKDLRVRIIDKDKEYFLNVENVNVKSLAFSKTFKISLGGRFEMTDHTKTPFNLSISKDNEAIIELDASKKIKNLEIFFPEISFAEEEENIAIKNLSASVIKITTYDDIVNSVIKAGSDSIIFEFKDEKNANKNYETNFELLISVINELNANGKSVNQDLSIEKFVFNDISNNFAFNVDGNIKSNFILNNANATVNLKLINYNSMVRMINNSDKYFILDKKFLSTLIEILNMIPANSQNTPSNKFYTLKYSTATRSFTINNVNGETAIRSLLLPK
jgi:hypothetical protein